MVSALRGTCALYFYRKEKIMKTLTTWNPFREMEEFQNRFNTFFGGFPTFPFRFPKNGERFKMPDWSPLVDIIEDDHEYLFKADLPEMRKEDVNVTIRKRHALHFRRAQDREGRNEEENSIGLNASSARLSAHSPCLKTRTQQRSWLSFMTAYCRFTCQNAPCQSRKRSK